MARKIRLGVIVPSSNTALEPLTQRIVATLQPRDASLEVTVHFARFRVTKIALSADANAQFAHAAMLEAALLLADAHVDVIGWSGTAASWLGFGTDTELCAAIARATGIPATSSVLAMNDILSRDSRSASGSASRPIIGLVTPYTPDVNAAIAANYADTAGLPIDARRSRCAGLSDNVAFSDIGDAQLDGMVADVVAHGANTVLIMCTNVAAAHRALVWERQYSIRVLDSVATVVRGMVKAVNIEIVPESVAKWGSVFD